MTRAPTPLQKYEGTCRRLRRQYRESVKAAFAQWELADATSDSNSRQDVEAAKRAMDEALETYCASCGRAWEVWQHERQKVMASQKAYLERKKASPESYRR
jgi:protein tyrosine phosphatase (PTP) superfamily phosphohydrolase (DUF442 family)